MPSSLISTALAGGLILAMFGTVLVVAKQGRPRLASALLGAGLIMWAAGLYFCPPMARILALGLFALVALSLPLSVASKSKQPKVAWASPFLVVFLASAGPLINASLNRLFVVQQSPALAAASVTLMAIATAKALILAKV